MAWQNEMSYPLGSASDAGKGIVSEYAQTVKAFNDIYRSNIDDPIKMLNDTTNTISTDEARQNEIWKSKILVPLQAQKSLNEAKMADLQLASGNMKLQQQHRSLQQEDFQLSGYNDFNNSLNDFVTPDGSYDIQSLTEAQPPSHLNPYQRRGWLQARDEVFQQAGQSDFLNKSNQIKQLNAQAELANQANMATAKQEMATLGIPLDDDSVNNYLKTVIYPRNKSILEARAAQQANPNIVTDSKGNPKMISGARGTATTGLTPAKMQLIQNLDSDSAAMIESFLDKPTDLKTKETVVKKLRSIGQNLLNAGLDNSNATRKEAALDTYMVLSKNLKSADTEIQAVEKKARGFWSPSRGGISDEEATAIQKAHANYDRIESQIEETKKILKTPAYNSIAQNKQASTIESSSTNMGAVEKAKQAIKNGASIDAVKKRLQENGIDPSLVDETPEPEVPADEELNAE